LVQVDPIVIAPALAFPFQDTRFLELPDNPLCCTFCDSDLLRDVAQARGRVLAQAHEDVGVIAKKGPVM
jgi:hypothetical protein